MDVVTSNFVAGVNRTIYAIGVRIIVEFEEKLYTHRHI